LGDAATATQSFSFSRLYRLRSPAEFRRVFEQATRSGDRFFTVLWRPNELADARVGFAIAKKRISLAVGRNRIRRIARESFRQQRGTLTGVDIVLLANSAANKASNKQLRQSLERHWENIRSAKSDYKSDQQNVSGRNMQRSRDKQ
jgi:ribonuclease P protein component